ncbi:M23 family metallopeptidase [Eubacteriales bacterium OttesenSCG-928-K08]|nr:M23 family metallopeptidase [Eubacteriales bacterium OttesenSCG-928-K08]
MKQQTNIGSKTYNLSGTELDTSKLKAGTYDLNVWAKNATVTSPTRPQYTVTLTVKAKATPTPTPKATPTPTPKATATPKATPTPTVTPKATPMPSDNITVSSLINYTITEGDILRIESGKVTSESSNLTIVTVNVYSAATGDIEARKTNIGAKTYSLSGTELDTSKLKAGTYDLNVWAKNATVTSPTRPQYTVTLTVKAKATPTPTPKATPTPTVTPKATPTPIVTPTPTPLSDEISIYGLQNHTIIQGEKLTIASGMVTSQISDLSMVTVNIENWGLDKRTETSGTRIHFLEGTVVNTSSLPIGTYTVQVWARNATYDGIKIGVFTLFVKPNENDNITVTGLSNRTITEGETLILNSGVVTSGSSDLIKVTVNTYNPETGRDIAAPKSNIGAKTYSLLGTILDTSTLKAGTYNVNVWASNATYTGVFLDSFVLTVKAAALNPQISNFKASKTVITEGGDFYLTYDTNADVKSVRIYVNGGFWAPQTMKEGISSYSTRIIDWLTAGTHTIKICPIDKNRVEYTSPDYVKTVEVTVKAAPKPSAPIGNYCPTTATGGQYYSLSWLKSEFATGYVVNWSFEGTSGSSGLIHDLEYGWNLANKPGTMYVDVFAINSSGQSSALAVSVAVTAVKLQKPTINGYEDNKQIQPGEFKLSGTYDDANVIEVSLRDLNCNPNGAPTLIASSENSINTVWVTHGKPNIWEYTIPSSYIHAGHNYQIWVEAQEIKDSPQNNGILMRFNVFNISQDGITNDGKFSPIWPTPGSFRVNSLEYYPQSGGAHRLSIDIDGIVSNKIVVAIEKGVVINIVNGCQHKGMKNCGHSQDGASGNSVWILHDNGYTSFYGHLEYGSIVVNNGQRVNKGQKLALMGTTGNSSGVHLHFHVKDKKGGNQYPIFKDYLKQYGNQFTYPLINEFDGSQGILPKSKKQEYIDCYAGIPDYVFRKFT